jgi:hypothetical protein
MKLSQEKEELFAILDLCVQKTQVPIFFNFMCGFDHIVTSVHYHEHPVDCVLLHNAEYIVSASNPCFREDRQL